MGGHMGDRTFDVFDWVPLIALIVATGLILSGLFPSGLGITNGNIILGRNGRIDEDKEMSILDQTLSKFFGYERRILLRLFLLFRQLGNWCIDDECCADRGRLLRPIGLQAWSSRSPIPMDEK